MKHLFKATILATAATALVATSALAADIDINIYGASAQYLFWNDAADDYLLDIGCTGVVQAEHTDLNGKKKHGITKGTCGADTVYIRYSSKASFDGIYSCKGEVPPDGQPTCDAVSPRHREMADESTTNWTTGVVADLACKEVTIGASDVNGATFSQGSHGQKKGHQGGGYIDRNINAIDVDGMTSYRPVVVPFGFFANTAASISNLTRLQALMVFSNKAWNWSDFGPTYVNKDVVACLRHAGSGTHATLDAAVMRGDWPLVRYEDPGYVWFNDGSSDEMKCVDENGGQPTASAAAVGYADSDYLAGHPGSYLNTVEVNYNGAAAAKDNIVNGVYSFWSAQWLFECEPSDPVTHPHVAALAAFASDAANLPASKVPYWATQDEMNVEKANDFAMPQFKSAP